MMAVMKVYTNELKILDTASCSASLEFSRGVDTVIMLCSTPAWLIDTWDSASLSVSSFVLAIAKVVIY